MILILWIVIIILAVIIVASGARIAGLESAALDSSSMKRIMDLEIQEKDLIIKELEDKLEGFGNLVIALEKVQQR